MDKQKLESLISQEEDPKLDFKAALDLETSSGKKELTKDIIALANSQGGRGYLVIGVEDKTKKIVGIKSQEINEERIQQVLALRCAPPVDVRVEYVEIEKRKVCVITVFKSYKKPHQMLQTGAFYIRRGSTTDIARRDEIASMLQKGGLINTEQMPILNMSLDIYDRMLMETYLGRINLKDQVDNYSLLADLGFVHYDREENDFCPTIGGLLFFCKTPQIYFPHVGIRVLDRRESIPKTVFITGNLFVMMDKVKNYLNFACNDYPVEAVEEAVYNAIVHRDYFDNSRDILLCISEKEVSVSSPGAIFGREKVANIMHRHDAKRRNNWLYHKLLMFDEKKRFIKLGTGLELIQQKAKPYGQVKILNLRKTDLFKVVLPGIKIDKK